jgi:AraC-like DNA-binding protein
MMPTRGEGAPKSDESCVANVSDKHVRPMFASSDVDEIRKVLNTYLAPGSVQVTARTGRSGEYRLFSIYERPVAGPRNTLSLFRVEAELELDLRAFHSDDVYTVDFTRSGLHDTVIDGKVVKTPHSFKQPGQDVRMRLLCTTLTILRIDRKAFDSALAARLDTEGHKELVFEPSLHADGLYGVAWMRLVKTLENCDAAELLSRSPLAAEHFEHLVIHGLLDILWNATHPHCNFGGIRLSGRALRAAIQFCQQNAASPISMVDIAAAANAGVRTVQRAFRAELGMSPMDYLKRVRLERVREDLLRIRQGQIEGTITAVATRWGFVHLGRFSQDYRDAYGERPSDTIGR